MWQFFFWYFQWELWVSMTDLGRSRVYFIYLYSQYTTGFVSRTELNTTCNCFAFILQLSVYDRCIHSYADKLNVSEGVIHFRYYKLPWKKNTVFISIYWPNGICMSFLPVNRGKNVYNKLNKNIKFHSFYVKSTHSYSITVWKLSNRFEEVQ